TTVPVRSWTMTRSVCEPVSSCTPLLAQLRPIFQALSDLTLEAALGRIVEGLAPELLGEIILAGEGVGRIMVVAISCPIAFRLHQLRRRVEDVLGRQQRARLLGRTHRRTVSEIGSIRFRRRRDID